MHITSIYVSLIVKAFVLSDFDVDRWYSLRVHFSSKIKLLLLDSRTKLKWDCFAVRTVLVTNLVFKKMLGFYCVAFRESRLKISINTYNFKFDFWKTIPYQLLNLIRRDRYDIDVFLFFSALMVHYLLFSFSVFYSILQRVLFEI